MKVLKRLGAVSAVAFLAFALPVTAANAADLSGGCTGSATSLDRNGVELDTATAPGEGATQSDPLVIDPEGSVDWSGSSGQVIGSGSWSVSMMGVPFKSGSFTNDSGNTSAAGNVSLADAPDQIQWILDTNAIVPVTGSMVGDSVTCTGSGFITGTGGAPMSSPVFYAGAVSAGLGAVLVAGMIVGTKTVAAGGAAAGVAPVKGA